MIKDILKHFKTTITKDELLDYSIRAIYSPENSHLKGKSISLHQMVGKLIGLAYFGKEDVKTPEYPKAKDYLRNNFDKSELREIMSNLIDENLAYFSCIGLTTAS